MSAALRNQTLFYGEGRAMAYFLISGARPKTVSLRRSRWDVRRRLGILGVLVGVASGAFAGAVTARTTAPAPAASELTVVELFTSQGCSSCPPANANLVRIARRSDVLALSFGVTYWDRLGWPDTFAQPAFNERQRDYQHGLGNDNVWTPQMVVDGRTDVLGGRMEDVVQQIAAHRPFTGPAVRFQNGGVGLAGGVAPTAPADVWLVRYEPGIVQVPVARGENGGRTLAHANVVRELTRLGQWNGETVGFRLPAAGRPGLATAVLVQGRGGGRILGVGRAT